MSEEDAALHCPRATTSAPCSLRWADALLGGATTPPLTPFVRLCS
ncbi:MAG: hypothetical protein ACLVB4_09065 [Butyricicoccus sp.]